MRFVAERSGQDLVEYAILAGFVAILGVALFPSIQAKMAAAFSGWQANVVSIHVPCDPGVAPPCP